MVVNMIMTMMIIIIGIISLFISIIIIIIVVSIIIIGGAQPAGRPGGAAGVEWRWWRAEVAALTDGSRVRCSYAGEQLLAHLLRSVLFLTVTNTLTNISVAVKLTKLRPEHRSRVRCTHTLRKATATKSSTNTDTTCD